MHWLDWIWPGRRQRLRARELANTSDSLRIVTGGHPDLDMPVLGGSARPDSASVGLIGPVAPPPFPPGHPRRQIERLSQTSFEGRVSARGRLATRAEPPAAPPPVAADPARLEPVS